MKTLWMASAILLLSAAAHASFRESATWRVAPDGLTQGGGRSASGSYIATQQAVGEIAGFTASASWRNQVGITQVDPVTQVPVALSRFQIE